MTAVAKLARAVMPTGPWRKKTLKTGRRLSPMRPMAEPTIHTAERADAGSMAGSEKRRPDPMAPVIATATAMPMATMARAALTAEVALRSNTGSAATPSRTSATAVVTADRPGLAAAIVHVSRTRTSSISNPTPDQLMSPSEPTRMAADAAMT